MNWSDLSMSSRSELMSIYLKNGITSLDEMKKHYNSFAEGGFASPSYPPFNNIPQRTDIYDNEKRARGKWHVENAKGNPNSVITKAFNEAKSKGFNDNQAYEYVFDVANSKGWTKEGSVIQERTIPYKATVNNTQDNTYVAKRPQIVPIQPQFVDYNKHQEKELRYKAEEQERELQARKDIATAASLAGAAMANKNPILGAMLQVPDIYMDWRYSKYPGAETSFNGLLETMAIADNSVIGDKVENVLFKVPKFGKYLGGGYHLFRGLNDYGIPIGATNDAIDLLTGKSGIEHIGDKLVDSDEVAANMLRTNIAKSNVSFANGGKLDTPPERFFGIATPEVTDNNIYYSINSLLPEINITAKGDPRKVNNDYYKAHAAERAAFEDRIASREDYKTLNPLNLLEYTPVIGDALDAANVINDVSNKNYLSAGISAGMFLLPNIIEKPFKGLKAIPIALSHNIKNNNLRNSLLGRNKSLLNPSMGLGHMKYNSNIKDRTALFFNKELLKEYPNQAYLGDGNTPMVSDFFDDNQLDLISRMSGRKINQTMRSKSGIPLSKLGAGEQIPYEDALQIARENRAKNDLVNTYNEIKFDGLIPINKSGYAFTDSEDIANMLTKRGIVNNFDFYSSNPEAYSSYETFLNDIVFNNPNYRFKDGGKIFIKPENRGKFTALKKRTGHSASWFKENGTPAQKKMAIFELSSKKWSKR